MGLQYEVYLNDGKARKPVLVEVVRSNKKTVWVRLPDGNTIKRHRERDVV